jgi:hypothetical protein
MQVAKRERGISSRWGFVIGGLALLGLIAAGWYSTTMQQRERQAVVAERGANVMPFDLDRTTHIFQNRTDGGLQQVVADDLSDAAQIALIRTHLQEEAAKFERGDFGDPASIHGQMMPGLSALRQGYAQITVIYPPPEARGLLVSSTSAARFRRTYPVSTSVLRLGQSSRDVAMVQPKALVIDIPGRVPIPIMPDPALAGPLPVGKRQVEIDGATAPAPPGRWEKRSTSMSVALFRSAL